MSKELSPPPFITTPAPTGKGRTLPEGTQAYWEGVHFEADNGKHGGKQCGSSQHCQNDDQHTTHTHRAQHVDAEESESEQANGNGEAGESDGAACSGDGEHNSLLYRAAMCDLFTET